MKNAVAEPLGYFEPDEAGNLTRETLVAGFKGMKVVLGE